MRRTLLIAAAGVLMVGTPSAPALSITVNENSVTRLDFTVAWDPDLRHDYVVDATGLIGVIQAPFAFHNQGGLIIEGTHSFPLYFGHDFPWFSISFFEFNRTFDGLLLVEGSWPDHRHALPGNAFGARFVYGPDFVPDGGNTLWLLTATLGALGWFGRHRRP